MNSTTIRACGAAVALGGVVWGTAGLVAPPPDGTVRAVEVWSSGAFLLGVTALVAAVAGTRATGDGRWGRGVVIAELVALALATLSTIITLGTGQYELSGPLLVLDMAWPLSMVGLIAVSVTVVVRRRWPARAGWLSLATSLWLPIGFTAPDIVTSIYLIVVPLLLGAVVAIEVPARDRRPVPDGSPTRR